MSRGMAIHGGRVSATVVFSDTVDFLFDAPDEQLMGQVTNDTCRAFHVNAAGWLHITDDSGNQCIIYVNQGQRYDYSIRRFWATGTDAAVVTGGIIAWR